MNNTITYEMVIKAVIDGDIPPTKKLIISGNGGMLKLADAIIFNLGQYIYTHCFVKHNPLPNRSIVNHRISYMLNYMPTTQYRTPRRYGGGAILTARNYLLESIAVALQLSSIYRNNKIKPHAINMVIHDAHYTFYNILNWAYLREAACDKPCPNEFKGLKYINENLNKLPEELNDLLKVYWINRVKRRAITPELQELQDESHFFYKPPIVKLNTVSQHVKSALRQAVII